MLVAAFRGSHDVGLYSLANKATSPIVFGAQALIAAWLPFVLKLRVAAPEDEPRFRGRTLTYVTAVVCAAAIALALFARLAVTFLGGDDFEAARTAVLPLAIGWAAYTTSVVLGTPFAVTRRTGSASVLAGVSATVNILLNLLLIPRFGFQGAAWATAVSFLLLAGLYAAVGARLSPLRLEPGRLAAIGVIAVAAIVVGTTIFARNTLARAVCAGGAAVGTMLVAASYRGARYGGRSATRSAGR
jgi:O-antigen/teichoic acid export membrane protein